MKPGQDRLTCTYCPKSFRSSNGLKYHLSKIHSEDELMDTMFTLCSHDPGKTCFFILVRRKNKNRAKIVEVDRIRDYVFVHKSRYKKIKMLETPDYLCPKI